MSENPDRPIVAPPASAADCPAQPAPISVLVQRIRDRRVPPETLTPRMRRECVEHLMHEGLTGPQMAQTLGIGLRTIRRDLARLRRQQALAPTLSLSDDLLGEFQRITSDCVQRLTRLSQSDQTPAYARLWAEQAIIVTYQKFIETAHRLEYLPTGKSRLAYLRQTDPQEQLRELDGHAAWLRLHGRNEDDTMIRARKILTGQPLHRRRTRARIAAARTGVQAAHGSSVRHDHGTEPTAAPAARCPDDAEELSGVGESAPRSPAGGRSGDYFPDDRVDDWRVAGEANRERG